MNYKLKKNILINIAEYVIKNKDVLSDEQLVSNFYDMLINILNDTSSESDTHSDESSYDIIDIDSD
jgi:hypothetical protein